MGQYNTENMMNQRRAINAKRATGIVGYGFDPDNTDDTAGPVYGGDPIPIQKSEANQSAQLNTSGIDTASTAMISYGGVYVKAAGLALKALTADAKIRQQQRNAEYREKINKKNKTTEAYNNLARIGAGLRNL